MTPPPAELSVMAFLALREALFGERADVTRLESRPYELPPKANAQDDPLDRHVASVLHVKGPDDVTVCAGGKNASPDLALVREGRLAEVLKRRWPSASAPTSERVAAAMEVKKLERTGAGTVRRRSGVDFNSTPPCDRLRVQAGNREVWVPGYYLFVVQEAIEGHEGRYCATGLVLCDGGLLNEDLELYRSRTGQRTKEIGLGTYGDGADRQRPMMIFANPFVHDEFDGEATLIHQSADLSDRHADLTYVAPLTRQAADGTPRRFHCYRHVGDLVDGMLYPPYGDFPRPDRSKRTSPRSRLEIPLSSEQLSLEGVG